MEASSSEPSLRRRAGRRAEKLDRLSPDLLGPNLILDVEYYMRDHITATLFELSD
jgi:hypothetical protein